MRHANAAAEMKRATLLWPFSYLARPERFELPTPWFVAKYSIQMSYGRVEEAALYGSLPFLPS